MTSQNDASDIQELHAYVHGWVQGIGFRYFVVENGGELEFQWFETEPEIALLGQVIIIVRPKKILDEELTKDSWQIDE